MSGLTHQNADVKLGQIGVFIANRPLLTLGLFIAALSVIGFANGFLSLEENRALMGQYARGLMVAILRMVLLISLLFFAPKHLKGRAVFALVCFTIVYFWLLQRGYLAAGGQTQAMGFALLLLVAVTPFCGPLIGRRTAFLMYAVPIFGALPLLALTGYLMRKGVLEDVRLPVLYALGLGAAAMVCVSYASRFLDNIAHSDSAARASARAINDSLRDVVFVSLSAAGLFAFYVRDFSVSSYIMPLGMAGFLIIWLCAGTALAGAAVMSAYFPTDIGHKKELVQREAGFARFAMFLDLRVTPVMYMSGLCIITILAISLAVDTPIAAYTGTRSVLAPVAKILFLVLMVIGATYAYKSMRVALITGIAFVLADMMTTSFFARTILAGDGVLSLTDVIPRLFALALVAVLAESWRENLNSKGRYGRGRTLVKAALVTGLPRVLASFLSVLMVLSAFGLWLPPEANTGLLPPESRFTAYAALRFEIEALLVLLITPMVMMVMNKVRLTL